MGSDRCASSAVEGLSLIGDEEPITTCSRSSAPGRLVLSMALGFLACQFMGRAMNLQRIRNRNAMDPRNGRRRPAIIPRDCECDCDCFGGCGCGCRPGIGLASVLVHRSCCGNAAGLGTGRLGAQPRPGDWLPAPSCSKGWRSWEGQGRPWSMRNRGSQTVALRGAGSGAGRRPDRSGKG
jgi:hypothetical protein